jgi:hypothetical protein
MYKFAYVDYEIQRKHASFLANFRSRLGKIKDTIATGGLFGNVGRVASPWADELAVLERDYAKKVLNRSYAMKKMPQEQADALINQHLKLQNTAWEDKILGDQGRLGVLAGAKNSLKGVRDRILGRTKGLSEEEILRNSIARHYDLSKFSPEQIEQAVASLGAKYKGVVGPSEFARGGLSSKIRETLGTANDVLNPMTLMFGNRLSRTRALHDFHQHGLLGDGSTIRKAFSAPDFGKTISGTIKPLTAAGAMWPVGSFANRVINPDAHQESLPAGAARDAGWYAGAALGMPFGVAGFTAGTTVGENLGKYVGSTISGT